MQNIPSLKEKVRRLPKTSGVYVMKDALGNVIYIGKAVNLRRRVGQYFMNSYKARAASPKIASLVDCIADFEFFNTRGDAEAVILESKLIKRWKPRYNTLEKDNKNFLLLRVETFAPLPRFAFARHRKDDGALYFGPYLGVSAIRSALAELKKRFGILLSDAHPKRLGDGRWMLYDDARSQITSFENIVGEAEYAERVKAALEYLRGRDAGAVDEAQIKMREASDALDFERAAKWRDLIAAIEETRVANTRAGVEADISASRAGRNSGYGFAAQDARNAEGPAVDRMLRHIPHIRQLLRGVDGEIRVRGARQAEVQEVQDKVVCRQRRLPRHAGGRRQAVRAAAQGGCSDARPRFDRRRQRAGVRRDESL